MRRPLFRPTLVGAVLSLVVSGHGCAQSAPRDQRQQLLIVGTDYAYDVPAEVPPGLTEVSFENRGVVEHEMALARLKPGVTMEEVLALVRDGGDAEEMLDGNAGILFAKPGESSHGKLLVDLVPGRAYGMICNFRDTPEAPPHLALGMHAGFLVSSAR